MLRYPGPVTAREPLTIEQAEALLDGAPLVAALGGKLDDIKVVRAKCLAAGIPVLMGCQGGGGG